MLRRMLNLRTPGVLPGLFLVLIVSMSGGCEKASDGGAPKLDRSKFEGVGQVGKVELLSAGEGDKQQIRFLFADGASERMRMSMEMDSKTGVNGADMEINMGMQYVMKAEMKELRDDRATLAFVIEDFSLDDAKTSPMLKQGLGALEGLLEGMSGSMQLDSRGQIHHVGYDMSSVPVAMRESLSQMEEGLKQMATTFPEEAVGVGAKWRLYQVLKTRGITIRQQLDLKLVKIDGATIHLTTKIAQDADLQVAEMPGVPPGANATVSSFWSTGTGTLVLDLKGIVPLRGTSDIKTKGKFSIDMGGDPVKMTMDAKIKVIMDRL